MEDSSNQGQDPSQEFPRLIMLVVIVLTLLAHGCSSYVGTTTASFLRKIREDPDPNVRYVAYSKLGQARSFETEAERSEAVRTLINGLEGGKEPVATRALIIHALGELRDPSARDSIVKALSDPEPIIRVQACRALGKVGRTEDATLLTRAMTVDTFEDCRIAAIDALGELKPDDARITRVLVAGMQHDDPATRLASLNALRKMTGRDLGTDPTIWARLLPPESPSPSLVASSSAKTQTTPAYPPALSPPGSLDPRTSPASFGGLSLFPRHNPNLPPQAAGR
ncbi:MAG: hypothetical protein NVSMB9_13240 [Isosphaeraceae bacterium]